MDGGWTGGKSEIRKFEMRGWAGWPGFRLRLQLRRDKSPLATPWHYSFQPEAEN